MSDDERNDLLELKSSIERHLLTLHDEIINLSPYEDDFHFNTLIRKAQYYRTILERIHQQLTDESI